MNLRADGVGLCVGLTGGRTSCCMACWVELRVELKRGAGLGAWGRVGVGRAWGVGRGAGRAGILRRVGGWIMSGGCL